MDRERAERAIAEFLDALGLDPKTDPELANTPALVAAAYADDLLRGYAMDPAAILGEALPSPAGEGLVIVRDLPASIMCPHHLMPATGVVHLAYAPAARVVGFGALGRLVDCFARRLILQETLVERIAEGLCMHLGARGAACAAVMAPSCLTARGERRHGSGVTCLATRGEMQPGQVLHTSALALLGAEVQR